MSEFLHLLKQFVRGQLKILTILEEICETQNRIETLTAQLVVNTVGVLPPEKKNEGCDGLDDWENEGGQ